MDVRTTATQLRLGLLLGAVYGLLNLVGSYVDPLAEDTVAALLVVYGPMFAVWALAGFLAARRGARILDAIRAGATVAFMTFVVFVAARLIVVNVTLEDTSQRLDWQNLVARFRASGFESLRAYANYEYVAGAPFKILVASAIGGVMGLAGGLCGRVGRSAAASRITVPQ